MYAQQCEDKDGKECRQQERFYRELMRYMHMGLWLRSVERFKVKPGLSVFSINPADVVTVSSVAAGGAFFCSCEVAYLNIMFWVDGNFLMCVSGKPQSYRYPPGGGSSERTRATFTRECTC